jgi:FkbM family methyltransferase
MLTDLRHLLPKYGLTPKGVLHIGAHVGGEAPVYNDLGIRKQVWIEANPEIFPKLCENLSRYNREVIALNYCIGDENRDAVLHITNNEVSSSVLELGTHKDAHPEICYVKDIPMKMYRVDSIQGVHHLIQNCDFLVIDLQGFELNALRGMGDLLKQFEAAYLEVHRKEQYQGCALIDSIDLFMCRNKFRRVQTWFEGSNGSGDALYITESSRRPKRRTNWLRAPLDGLGFALKARRKWERIFIPPLDQDPAA